MGTIPAICNNCGTIFPSGFACNARITMKNCISGPCPGCGGNGNIPDGIYDFASKTINLVKKANVGYNRLEEIIGILTGLKKENADYEIIKNQINKDVSELSSLSSVLPKTRIELYAFVTAIILILTFILTNLKSCGNITEDNVNEIIEDSFEQMYEKDKKQNNNPTSNSNENIKPHNKIGRNELCPCGSGKKYKKCCFLKNIT